MAPVLSGTSLGSIGAGVDLTGAVGNTNEPCGSSGLVLASLPSGLIHFFGGVAGVSVMTGCAMGTNFANCSSVCGTICGAATITGGGVKAGTEGAIGASSEKTPAPESFAASDRWWVT